MTYEANSTQTGFKFAANGIATIAKPTPANGVKTILRRRHVFLPVLAILALNGCAQRDKSPVTLAAATDPHRVDAPAAIGTGPFRYRYALLGENGRPMANTPFALSLRQGELPFVPGTKKVWQNVTDATGHTPVFAMPSPLTADQVYLRPRFGSGPYGEQMMFSTPDGSPLGDVDYQLVICTDPPTGMTGHAGHDGNLPYAASEEPARVVVKLLFAKLIAGDEEPDKKDHPAHDPIDEWRETCSEQSAPHP